jgi:hypothetical protein
LDGPVVLPPEIVARFSEVSHGQPACPQSTWATHTMTLALLFQEPLHSLPEETGANSVRRGLKRVTGAATVPISEPSGSNSEDAKSWG